MKTKWSYNGKGSERKIESLDKSALRLVSFFNMPYSDMNFACAAIKIGIVPYNGDNLNLITIRDEVTKNPKLYDHPSVTYLKRFYYGLEGTTDIYNLETAIAAVVLKEAPTMEVMRDILQTYFGKNSYIAFYCQSRPAEWFVTKSDFRGDLKIIQASSYFNADSMDTDWINIAGTNDHEKYIITPKINASSIFLEDYDDSKYAGLMLSLESNVPEQAVLCGIFAYDLTFKNTKIKYLKEFQLPLKTK